MAGLKWLLGILAGILVVLAGLWGAAIVSFKGPEQVLHRPLGASPNFVKTATQVSDSVSLPYSYSYAYVEFNNKGEFSGEAQVERVLADLRARVAQTDTVILVYVHGWNHDAREGDTNVTCFEEMLKATAIMQATYTARGGTTPRGVYGIFVGWPGLVYDDKRQLGTFFGRQSAADRVGERGDLLDLFSRISRIRHETVSRTAKRPQTKFVIVSHSLGARLTYRALRPVMRGAMIDNDSRSPFLADVAVMVNPALSADEHASLARMVEHQTQRGTDRAQPRFIIATSESDEVLQNHFVLSQRAAGWIRGEFKPAADPSVWPIGLYDDYLTHTLKLTGTYLRPAGRAACPTMNHDDLEIVRGKRRVKQESELYDYRVVRHYDDRGQETYRTTLEETGRNSPGPLMVVKVAQQIIPNHNDIFTSPFVDFVSRAINAGLYGPRNATDQAVVPAAK